jgi:hypothetical protein
MNIAFTICSNNYLSHAKTLCDSIIENNSGYQTYIILCDKQSANVDYSFFYPSHLIMLEDLLIENMAELLARYSILEMNTSIKPAVFRYLYSKHPGLESLIYLDPDIMVFGNLHEISNEFPVADILITPHITQPLPLDGLVTDENKFLLYGLYNLGFIATGRWNSNIDNFLIWWQQRTFEQGYYDLSKGLFVDQLWINLAPLFFERVKVMGNKGWNVGPWNMQERLIVDKKNDVYILADGSRLLFFHFSSYKFNNPKTLTNDYNRVRYGDNCFIDELYDNYYARLIENKVESFSQIRYGYLKELEHAAVGGEVLEPSKLKQFLLLFAPPIFWKIYYTVKVKLLKF